MKPRELSEREEAAGISLCWRCNGSMLFFQNPCPHCAATNPNVDLDAAMKEMESGL